jgi:threonine dehydrogenase-like Zn-dependent dehydrogenase
MTRVFTRVIGLVLAVVVSGCGGSGAPAVSETSGSPSPTPTVTTLPQHGGLVGIIDTARKQTVCANVQLFATTVEGGLTSSANEAFAALIQTLRQGPREVGLNTLVRRWQRWRNHLGDAKTAQRLTAFCSR